MAIEKLPESVEVYRTVAPPSCVGCKTMNTAVRDHNISANALLASANIELIVSDGMHAGKLITAEEAELIGAMDEYNTYKEAKAKLQNLKARCKGAEDNYINGKKTVVCGVAGQ